MGHGASKVLPGVGLATFFALAYAIAASSASLQVPDDLHFPLFARGTNKDGSTPVYKNARAAIEDRVDDLLPRMTLEEKVSQLCVTFITMILCIKHHHSIQIFRLFNSRHNIIKFVVQGS